MEVLIGTALLVVVMVAFYSSFTSLFQLANASKFRSLAVELADEQFEIIRNMPYVSVGLTNGIPQGILNQTQILNRGGAEYVVDLTIRNINLSTTTVQASDKLVEVRVDCPGCKNFEPVVLTGHISPANLASAGDGGALVTKVFDALGNPVQGATVNLVSVATSSITNNDTTNNFGVLNVIGIPQGSNMYRMAVTKEGYSTDRTYPLGDPGNPNPTKPDVTVLDKQATNVSFSIDKLSSVHFYSVDYLCNPRPNFHFTLTGTKEIGLNLPKYSSNLSTNSSGILNLDSMEWDTYKIIPTDAAYDVAGINPNSPFDLNPDNAQKVQFVLAPKTPRSLMVTVVNSVDGLPLSGATVHLEKVPGYNQSKITGQGYLSQTDWSGGPGQDLFSDLTKYFAADANIDTATSSGDIVMKQVFGSYNTNATGTLESSTFDIGTSSNFYNFSWNPTSQPALSGNKSVKFQFAANASSSDPWVYLGPDGTVDTYYDSPDMPISSANNGKRYARYVAYLSTDTATVTPMVSDIAFSYTSDCLPPGQVLFQGLSSGTYILTITKSGYTDFTENIDVADDWGEKKVSLFAI